MKLDKLNVAVSIQLFYKYTITDCNIPFDARQLIRVNQMVELLVFHIDEHAVGFAVFQGDFGKTLGSRFLRGKLYHIVFAIIRNRTIGIIDFGNFQLNHGSFILQDYSWI